jgi:putative membrane protein
VVPTGTSTAKAAAGRRTPRWVYGHGTEPDPRFTLANERTFLAWVRTCLALVAGGVALEALAVPLEAHLRLAASVVLLVLALLVAPVAWLDWGRTERAMRRADPLPATWLTIVLTVGLVAVTGLVLVALLLGPAPGGR